jgi:aminopeptidase-like protein
MESPKKRWLHALNSLWNKNRVHACKEMSEAYRTLCSIYPNSTTYSFDSGDRVNHWEAPPAWEVEYAKLYSPSGEIIADWDNNPLHLFTYSPPFSGIVSREELEEHLLSIPSKPQRIPFHFRNQYRFWNPIWGFCLSDHVRKTLPAGDYKVEIMTRFEAGQMEMVEQVVVGESKESLLLIGHFDHPYMCNDGLVGCLAGHETLSRFSSGKTKLTYRMLSTVEIVGSVFYAERLAKENNVKEGLFVASSGADAPIVYQTSFKGNSVVDTLMKHILKDSSPSTKSYPFRKGGLGNDEIAFDVTGVEIPCASIMRAPFDQYHTDLDNPDSVYESKFEEVVAILIRLINILEKNSTLVPNFSGLPCLSNPNLDLYLPPLSFSHVKDATSSRTDDLIHLLPEDIVESIKNKHSHFNDLMTLLPIMCDGINTVFDVAEKVDLPFEVVDIYTNMWVEKNLINKYWINPLH